MLSQGLVGAAVVPDAWIRNGQKRVIRSTRPIIIVVGNRFELDGIEFMSE